MSTVLVNGHPAETGCYVEGHRGWHGLAHMIAQAESFGYVLDDEAREAIERYEADDYDPATDDVMEVASAVGDEAEQWLNDHTPPVCVDCGEPMEWVPSGWFRHAHSLRGECGTKLTDTVRLFVWHWRDGEFFLSPMCEDGDCDDDTCAHWD